MVDKDRSYDLQGLSTGGKKRECIMRIMIADRDWDLLDGLRETLGYRGHETQIATGGLECLAQLRDSPPDMLALGDGLLWGGGDGVLAVMAQEAHLQEIPVLLLVKHGNRSEFIRHPLVISVIRYPAPLHELARQFALLALLCDPSSFTDRDVANPEHGHGLSTASPAVSW